MKLEKQLTRFTVKAVIGATLLAILAVAAFAEGLITGYGQGTGSSVSDAIAQATVEATNELYANCTDGNVKSIYVHTTNVYGNGLVYTANVQATAVCEAR